MRATIRLFGLLLGAALALTAVPSAHGATQLGDYAGATGVSASRDTAAWSAYDPATNQFRLMLWQSGTVRAAAVRPRGVPFDADVGRDGAGRPRIVYSRCAAESYAPHTAASRTRGCDLYALDPRGDREHRIRVRGGTSADDSRPVVSGNRIVFARVHGGHASLRVSSLRGGRVSSVPLPGTRGQIVRDWELRGRTLALSVIRSRAPGAPPSAQHPDGLVEVRLQRLDGRHRRVVDRRAIGLSGRSVVGLGFDGTRLGFAVVCEGDCGHGLAFRFSSGRLARVSVPLGLTDFALARDRVFWVNRPGAPAGLRWTVVDAGALAFRR